MAVIGVVVLGSGAAWYVVSGQTVAATKRLVLTINGKVHADGSSLSISYEKLQRTGFPSIGVRFVNPVLDMTLPAAGGKLPLHINWKRTGTLDVVTDYIAHEYRVNSRGTGALVLMAGDQTINAESAESDVKMSLTARSFSAFKAWNALDIRDSAAFRAALKNVAGVTIDSGPLLMKDTATGNPIFAQDKATLAFTNRSTDQRIDFDLDTLVQGSQVSQAYNDAMARLMTVLMTPEMPIDIATMPFSATRAGKQDADLAVHVSIPTSNNAARGDGVVDIRRLSLKNDFYALSLPLKLLLKDDGSMRRATAALDWTLEATPAGAAEMQYVVMTALNFLPEVARAGTDGRPAIDRTALKDQFIAALPVLSTLGPVNLALDFDVAMPSPGAPGAAPAQAKQSLTVRRILLGHKRWSLLLKGEGERDSAASNIDFTLTCAQCDVMAADTVQTAQQLQEALTTMSPARPTVLVDAATLPKVNTMLAEVGAKDAEGNVVFVIKTAGPNDLRVNDKPAAEAMIKVTAALMPPQPAPVPQVAPAVAPAAKVAPAKHKPARR
ncbi:MAG: hypothetical protein V4735_04955 [Pseudomonadota bacterium]